MNRHECNKTGWTTCTACDGRLHLGGCTTRKNPLRDCCTERHELLKKQGHLYGLFDKSVKL